MPFYTTEPISQLAAAKMSNLTLFLVPTAVFPKLLCWATAVCGTTSPAFLPTQQVSFMLVKPAHRGAWEVAHRVRGAEEPALGEEAAWHWGTIWPPPALCRTSPFSAAMASLHGHQLSALAGCFSEIAAETESYSPAYTLQSCLHSAFTMAQDICATWPAGKCIMKTAEDNKKTSKPNTLGSTATTKSLGDRLLSCHCRANASAGNRAQPNLPFLP